MEGSLARIRITVEYDGADFAGWQRQQSKRTVQGCLEEALAKVTGSECRVIGAGRTDAGVHAAAQVAHFDTMWNRSVPELAKALNAVLPYDAAVLEAVRARDDFHARYSALTRVYRYRVCTRRVRSPLVRRQTWHVPGPLDADAMRRAGQVFVGVHDFRRFGRPTADGGPTIRRMDRCDVVVGENEVVIEFEANAFLRHQARRMTATLIDVGRGRQSMEGIQQLLDGDWTGAPPRRAPAQGLVLLAVKYPGATPADDPLEQRDGTEDMEDKG